jgi:hypothetical protein
VTLDRFGKVCDLFGPVLAAPPKRSSNILQNVHDVLRNDWFHGEISREEAESRLTGVVPGTYLVRHPLHTTRHTRNTHTDKPDA